MNEKIRKFIFNRPYDCELSTADYEYMNNKIKKTLGRDVVKDKDYIIVSSVVSDRKLSENEIPNASGKFRRTEIDIIKI